MSATPLSGPSFMSTSLLSCSICIDTIWKRLPGGCHELAIPPRPYCPLQDQWLRSTCRACIIHANHWPDCLCSVQGGYAVCPVLLSVWRHLVRLFLLKSICLRNSMVR